MAEDERDQPWRKIAKRLVGTSLTSLDDLNPDQMRDVILELEMQNEELIRAEAEIARLTTLYAVLSRVNEAIVRTHGEEALYQDVCRIVAEEGGFPLVWVGRVKGRQVMPAASSGPAADYLKEIRVDVEGEFGGGPTGTCIREDRPVVNDDFDINPSTAPWREPALRYGFRASAALPLRRQGRVVGALTLYAAAPGVFDRDHVKLLEALCADISYALDAMHQEQLRTGAEKALRESEERFRSLFTNMTEGFALHEVITDAEGRPVDYRFLEVNPSFEKLTGLKPSELVGRRVLEVLPLTEAYWLENYGRVALTGEPTHFENYSAELGRWYEVFAYQSAPRQFAVIFTDITARKRAEEALRASEEQYRRLVELSPEAIYVNRDNRIELVNPAALRLFGATSADQILGKSPFDLFHPDFHPVIRERIWKLLEGRSVALIEEKIVRLDGTDRDVEVAASFYDDELGRAIQVILRDITERKQAEQRIRTSEKSAREHAVRLQTVLDAAPAMIWISRDRECREITGNRAAHVFSRVADGTDMSKSGATPERLEHYRIFADGMELAAEEMPIQRVAASGEALRDYALDFVFDDGAVRSLLGNVNPLLDADGKPEGAVGAFLDVTERKQAEQALEHSLRRFELLAETAGELLQSPEPQRAVDGLCRKVMEHLDCHAFFNFLMDEGAGRLRLNACAGIPPEQARRIEWLDYGASVCGCAARDGLRVRAEHIPTTPDVRTELVKSHGIKAYACHPLLGAGGRVIGTLSFGTRNRETFSPEDLSLMKAVADQVAVAMIRMQGEQALRASEEALRQANQQLEAKVRERTAELVALNENLMKSRDQLRSLASELILTEARERRAVAVDLHDSVAQMLAIAKLTLESTAARLEGKSAEDLKRVVEFIRQATLQTRSLMADLSPPLLYEAGLEQALRALARRMGELHSLGIAVVDDGSPKPLAENYRVLVFRAVQELLTNAVKHAKAKKVTVSLHRENNRLRIEVEDDGVGFASCHVGPVDVKEGAFGLFSVRERIEHLGGSFEVVSRPGGGVCATLLVPLQEEKGDGARPAVIKILIADDHQMMRDALASLLEKEPGFEVVGLAADGLEAVRLAREVKPHVVVMDINMPGLDGIEAARQILAALPDAKVIGLSVEAKSGRMSEMLLVGATAFVPKSSSPEELAETIRTAAGSTQGR
jgi:PAS domain S-box-containing protein